MARLSVSVGKDTAIFIKRCFLYYIVRIGAFSFDYFRACKDISHFLFDIRSACIYIIQFEFLK